MSMVARKPMPCAGSPKSGSALVIVATGLILVFLAGSWFARHMIAIRNQTHRQGSQQLTWNFVRGLSILAAHKIQYDLLSGSPSDDRLKTALSLPLDKLRDLSAIELDLAEQPGSLRGPLERLVSPVAAQGRISHTITYTLNRDDFEFCGATAFPREKRGLIRLVIETEFKGEAETHLFAIPVRVAATVIPGISKFSLFLQDATDGDAGGKNSGLFNIISTDIDGKLRPGSRGKPIVLENGDLARGDIKWENFFNKPVGLVYLGGGDVILNLARGESRTGDYGEAFHFYEVNYEGFWDGLYATKIGNHPTHGAYALMNWDKGICDDFATPEAREWWSFVISSPNAGDMRLNSALKLFGTDKKQSPTLVLGRVFRGQITARAYKTADESLPSAFFYHIEGLDMWRRALDDNPCMAADDGINTIARFARDVLELEPDAASLEKYQQKYASDYSHYPYNSSLAFYATNNMVADAPSKFGGELGKRMEVDRTNPLLDTLPAELRPVFGNTSTVPSLLACLKGGDTVERRMAWSIDLAGKAGAFPECLVSRGLARMEGETLHLSLNGWIRLERVPGTGLVFDRPVVVDGPGGILLDRGSIVIRAPIDGRGNASRPPTILTLATCDGDLTVETEGRVDAALVAPGRVCIGKGDPGRVSIWGSVAAGRMDLKTASEGARIQYNAALACLPPYLDETPALSYSVDPNPILVK
ncbi:MAG TPA: hypothetical protein PLP29_07990 [Candidatus Ozemobacteraceae bacterium]|nr:hypothetical protein [Candidatus Ozemobacteraceae bacterium]